MLAATVRVTGDIDLAEECVQDAYARALATWSTDGIPAKPGAWLTTVARRRAIDVLRRASTHRPRAAAARRARSTRRPEPGELDAPDIVDDRLRLIFTCCHPAIAPDAQVALTLRLLCGLTTAEVARAFLVSEPTMAARITRAKKKIAVARIPYRVPPVEELPARIDAVLTVVHLLFTTGHTAPAGADLIRRDLVERSLDLARMLRALLPDDADVAGLLALILLTDARRATRLGDDGQLVLLADQDRVPVGPRRHPRGHRPRARGAPSPAAGSLRARWPPSPRCTPRRRRGTPPTGGRSSGSTTFSWRSGRRRSSPSTAPSPSAWPKGPTAGLAALDALATEPVLATYSYLASARADFLRRLGRTDEARLAYEEALLLSENAVERAFLTSRLRELSRR